MGTTNQEKEQTCNKHRVYLDIIYHLGNKVILMKQLFEYAKVLGITQTYSVFLGHVYELVSAKIVRQEPFTAYNKKTSLHMLILRKFGIRYIQGKKSSNAVSAVPKTATNERILVSLFNNCYIIDKVIPRIIKKETLVTLEKIFTFLEKDVSTMLFKKNQGLDYINRRLLVLKEHLDDSTIGYDIYNLSILWSKKKAGLEKGSKATQGKGTGNHYSKVDCALDEAFHRLDECQVETEGSKKKRKHDNYTIDSMLAAFIHIAQIKIHEGSRGKFNAAVTILIFDVYNKQDIYSLAIHIACVYKMLKRFFKDTCDINLKVGIVSMDQEASHNIQMEAKRIIRDARTKELVGPLLNKTLSSWGLNEIDQEKIEVQFRHYDITNKYLDGIKHANLMRR